MKPSAYHASSVFADSKPHLVLLDALRGIAAFMVIFYHVFEGFATSPQDQIWNHGYLAVDFFFVLSGFVIGYAYDDRWKTAANSSGKLSIKNFFLRRLIRLHPMVVVGTLVGALTFLIQGGNQWDGTHIAWSGVLLAILLGCLMLPAVPGAPGEVRGNGEMFPLNGPAWSLFFEYIGNILYALLLRRLPTRIIAVLAVIFGVGLSAMAVSQGYLGLGWSLSDLNIPGGLLRMLFSYTMGMLLARRFATKPKKVNTSFNANLTFIVSSIVLILISSMPYMGTAETGWTDGIYDSIVVVLAFPTIVWLVARNSVGAVLSDHTLSGVAWMGNISYPLYIVHYPFMYLFFYFVGFPNATMKFEQVWPYAILTVAVSLLVATLCLKFIDEPVRKYFSRKCFGQKKG